MHCWGSGNLGRCHLLERTFDPPRVRFPDNAAVFFFFFLIFGAPSRWLGDNLGTIEITLE